MRSPLRTAAALATLFLAACANSATVIRDEGDSGAIAHDAAAPDGDVAAVDAGGPRLDAADAPDADTPDAADGAALPPMPTQSFLIGYNEAWWASNFATGLTSKWDVSFVASKI